MNGFTGSLEDKTFAALLPIQLFFAPYFIILEHADQKKMHAALPEYLKDSNHFAIVKLSSHRQTHPSQEF